VYSVGRGDLYATAGTVVFRVEYVMSLVICAVGNSSFHCVWEFIAEDIQDCFYTDMLLNLLKRIGI
jgi:hypothetical protein